MTKLSNRQNYTKFARWVQSFASVIQDDKDQYYWCYKAVSGMLYDLQPIYSGYTSIAAIKLFNGRTTKMTREHYHSRTRSAHVILEHVMNGSTVEQLVDLIKQSVMVHYTTAKENSKLAAYQNADDYDWKKAYKKAGIELVRFDGLKKWYQIDGIRYYNTKKELKVIFGVGDYKLNKMIEDTGEKILINPT